MTSFLQPFAFGRSSHIRKLKYIFHRQLHPIVAQITNFFRVPLKASRNLSHRAPTVSTSHRHIIIPFSRLNPHHQLSYALLGILLRFRHFWTRASHSSYSFFSSRIQYHFPVFSKIGSSFSTTWVFDAPKHLDTRSQCLMSFSTFHW